MMRAWRDELDEQGFVRIPGVFEAERCAEIRDAAARILALAPGRAFDQRFGNVRFFSGREPDGTESLRSVIWCALLDERLEALRRDARLLDVLEPLIGDTLRQVTNQIHYKLPHSRTSFPLHSDRSSRQRAQGAEIRNLEASFYQTAIVAEPMGDHNGGLYFLPGSHRWSPGTVYAAHVDEARRPEEDFQAEMPEGCVSVEANAGDLLIWHGDAVHGSALNHASHGLRALYLNGYCRATDSLRGYWAWIRGQPVPMPDIDVPVLVYGEPRFEAFALEAGRALLEAYRGNRYA